MTECEITLEIEDGVLVAHLEGEIDMANVEVVRGSLARAMTNDAVGAVLDLTETDFVDSTGINLLFALRERLRVRGQRLHIVVPDGSLVHDALRYAGVLDSLEVSTSVTAARVALAGGGTS